MNLRLLAMVTTLALAACATEGDGAQLLVPVDLDFTWDDAYNAEGDGLAAVVPFDVMVYDRLSGEPIPGVVVELQSEHAALLHADRVESGPPDCADCVWDAQRDAYVVLPEVGGEASLVVVTDDEGLARVQAVVDSLPVEGSEFVWARIAVAAEGRAEVVRLLPR